jgi:hypothetical protein
MLTFLLHLHSSNKTEGTTHDFSNSRNLNRYLPGQLNIVKFAYVPWKATTRYRIDEIGLGNLVGLDGRREESCGERKEMVRLKEKHTWSHSSTIEVRWSPCFSDSV